MSDQVDDERYDELMEAISARVEDRFPDGMVTFSAFDHDAEGLPLDNLDSVAIEGMCVLVKEHDAFWGEGKAYESTVLNSAAWWVVLQCANEMVEVTGNKHHIFLEGVTKQEESVGHVACYSFDMGS